ncbi:MAG: Asp-tRNA(Asn)/Glu-tRNA(Gln) amidotransferase subunit GatB, partial [Dehalococcoidia bacterium]
MEYETVIGLEVHVQLQTRSKMFCSCPADYQTAPPNSRVCPVCLGLPGTLPVINRRAVEYTIMTGLALGCQIPEYSKFDRKNYPYPDLMKGYQISQYDLPLAVAGCLEIEVEGQSKSIGVDRVHLEEDAAKLLHFPSQNGDSYSLVDVNRAGVPLMEVVSSPDMRSPEEARSYLMTLHSILQYLGVSTANMQDGNFRCDANVSLRSQGSDQFGTRTEVKNMNSFRSVFLALNYEVERHRRILEDGGCITQETRGWVEERNVTVSQRSKEQAHDYRYFPDPDLPPLVIDRAWVEEIRSRLPELAGQRRDRFVRQYGLSEYDANLLTGSKAMADYFEEATGQKQLAGPALETFAKNVGNWMLGDLSRLLNLENQSIGETKVKPSHIVELIDLLDSGA